MTLRYTSKVRLREVIFQRLEGFSIEYLETYAETMTFTDWETPEEFFAKYGPDADKEKWAKYAHVTNLYNIVGIICARASENQYK